MIKKYYSFLIFHIFRYKNKMSNTDENCKEVLDRFNEIKDKFDSN